MIELDGYLAGRKALRQKRFELMLSIPEVEDIAGLCVDHVAKFEATNSARQPNVDTFIKWANALGYKVALVPTDPPKAVRFCLDQLSEQQLENRKRWAERTTKVVDEG